MAFGNFSAVMSLGWNCETKFQIARYRYFSTRPDASRNDLWQHIKNDEETHIFDWQVTPFPAVLSYMERDFCGVFERSDLAVDYEWGGCRNLRFDVHHTHAFHASAEKLTDADIDRQYPEARSKIAYLADKFRRFLDQERGPVLYIATRIPPAEHIAKLIDILKSCARRQRFHIAFVGKCGVDIERDFSSFGPRISQQFVSATSNKDAKDDWEGDDETWTAALDRLAQLSVRRFWPFMRSAA